MPNNAKGKVIRMSKIVRLALVLCVVFNLCVAVNAAGNDIDIEITGNTAVITGTADFKTGTEVSIEVVRPQKDISVVREDSLADSSSQIFSNFLCIAQTSVTSSKDFSYTVKFDDDEKSGTYRVRVQVYGESTVREKEFQFVNVTRQSSAQNDLDSGTTPIATLLENYAPDLDIDAGEKYNAFSEKEKNYVKGGVSAAASGKKAAFIAAVNDVTELKNIKTLSKEDLKVFVDAGNVPGVDATLYSKYSSMTTLNKDLFISNLYSRLGGVEIPSELKTEFEGAANSVTSGNTPNYQTGGVATVGGGGGGGGGFSLGGGSTPLPNNTTNNQSGDKSKGGFADLGQASWAENAINILSERGIIKGRSETEFCPQDTITREEFLRLVVASLNIIGVSGSENAFSDVDTDAWYASTVETAVACGIVSGMSEDRFGVGLPITRQDMATILYRAIKYAEVNLYSVAEPEFSDEEDIPDYAKEAVSTLSKAKVINGMEDGTFMPQKTATRAEAAVMLYNLLYR